MTDQPHTVAPGWYPDPGSPAQMRFWNGSQWTGEQYALPADNRVVLGKGFQRLALSGRIALKLVGMLMLAQGALYVWGLSMFGDAVETGDVDRLTTYDDVDQLLSVLTFVVLAIAGILWAVWQRRLAKTAYEGELTRGPAMHAWSWFIPVVSLWFPYQNVRDLWRRRDRYRSTSLLAWWWTCWIGFGILDRIYAKAYVRADDINELETVVAVGLVSVVLALIALSLALRIQRALSDAERPISPATSPGA